MLLAVGFTLRASLAVLLLTLWSGASGLADEGSLLSAKQAARIQHLIAHHLHGDLRKELAVLGLAIARRSDAVKAEFARLQADFDEARGRWLRDEVEARFVDTARSLLRDRVQQKGQDDRTTMTWVEHEFVARLLATIAKSLEPNDRVTSEEVRGARQKRRKDAWHALAYAPGRTFRNAGDRELWWKSATVPQQVEWLLYRFIERSGLFKLGTPDRTPCPTCKGTGIETRVLCSGSTLHYLCSRCGGSQVTEALRWR